jgi:hypothetical protein
MQGDRLAWLQTAQNGFKLFAINDAQDQMVGGLGRVDEPEISHPQTKDRLPTR